MKKRIMTAALAVMMALAGGEAAAQNETQSAARAATQTAADIAQPDRLKVRITGVGEDRGTIMVALGDYTDPSGMVAAMVPAGDAKDGAVECTLRGEIDLGATLYVFLDANGNYDLDRDEKGIPVEKCAYGSVILDANGTATIELKHYNN